MDKNRTPIIQGEMPIQKCESIYLLQKNESLINRSQITIATVDLKKDCLPLIVIRGF